MVVFAEYIWMDGTQPTQKLRATFKYSGWQQRNQTINGTLPGAWTCNLTCGWPWNGMNCSWSTSRS